MKVKLFILVWKEEEQQEINATTLPLLVIKGGHNCEACVQPTSFISYADFKKHLADAHNLTLKQYFRSFHIHPRHMFSTRNAVMDGSTKYFRHNASKKMKVMEATASQNEKPIFSINGEMVKRITIDGIPAYRRMMKKKSGKAKHSLTGGLVEEDLEHVPQVDPNYILDEEYHKATIRLLSAEGYTSLLLTGDTGYGKTSSVEQIAAQMHQPLLRVNMTGSTKVEHLLQEQVVDTKKKEIRWDPRDLFIAWLRGYWLLVDEVSAANPQVIFLFFRLLEAFPTLKTFEGKVYKPHPMTKIIFTDNRIGNPNYYKYHGTQAQNLAFVSRITSTVVYGSLSVGNEKRMLKNRYPSVDTTFIGKLVVFAGDVRKAIEDGQYNEFLGTRDLEHIVQNFISFRDPMMALHYGYLNKLQEATDKEFVRGIFQRTIDTPLIGL